MGRRLFVGSVLLALVVPSGAIAETAKPVALLDGASMRVEVGGTARVVRVLGLVAPPAADCLRDEMIRFASTIRSEFALIADPAVAGEDERGNLLRHVDSASVDLGADLLRRGLAITANGQHARSPAHLAAETEARKAQRGVWGAACTTALAEALRARSELPLRQLPRGGTTADAQEAIARLHERNASGENRVEDNPRDAAATGERRAPATEAQRSPRGGTDRATNAAPRERAPEPGRAVSLSGPRIRKSSGGTVRIEGKFWNAGETAIRGRVRIELRDNGALVDSTSVSMSLAPDAEQSYSVDLSPGGSLSNLTATATWDG